MIEEGTVDIGITGIPNVSLQSNLLVYTLPYYSTPLALLAHETSLQQTILFFDYLYSSGFILHFSFTLFLILFAGIAYALLEKRHTLHNAKSLEALGQGIYWATGAFTSIGTELTPDSLGGKIFFGLYTLLCALLLSLLSGSFCSIVTMQTVAQGSTLNILNMDQKSFGVKKNTFAQHMLAEQNISYKSYDNFKDALTGLEQNTVEAILLPSNIAYYMLQQEDTDNNIVMHELSPTTVYFSYITRRDYPLLDSINDALISISYSEKYVMILSSYLNSSPGS